MGPISPGLIKGLRPANERRRYIVTTSLIGWVRALDQLCKRVHSPPGIILGMGSVNERRRYCVASSLIGRAHTENDPCNIVAGPSTTIMAIKI